MSSNVFRHIGKGAEAGKPERLFRAAVCAFCSLLRPTRREVAQLDDLALPLFDRVAPEGRRFAAAALSECDPAPPGLIRRLCDEPVTISAPLLLRSPLVTDVHLISLIGRHGVEHARVIARRHGLNPTIRDLVRALLAHSDVGEFHGQQGSDTETRMPTPVDPTPAASAEASPAGQPARSVAPSGQAAEEARKDLRAMMQSKASLSFAGKPLYGVATWNQTADIYDKVQSTALAGKPDLFATALADVLEILPSRARDIIAGQSCSDLLTALRALDLPVEKAFVIAAAIFPGHFTHAEAIRLFMERFNVLGRETARNRIRGWKADGLAAHFQHAKPASHAPRRSELKAS